MYIDGGSSCFCKDRGVSRGYRGESMMGDGTRSPLGLRLKIVLMKERKGILKWLVRT